MVGMQRIPGGEVVPDVLPASARLRRVLLDALADTEQLRQRLDAAQQAAADLEQRLDAAVKAGLIEHDKALSEHSRAMVAAVHQASAASWKVFGDIGRLG
jgi:hypothetical protein